MAASPNEQDKRVGAGQDEVWPGYAPSVQIIGILTLEKQQSGLKPASSGLPPYKTTVTPSSNPNKPEPKYKVGGPAVSYKVIENGKRVPKKYNIHECKDMGGHFLYVLKDDDGNLVNDGDYISPSQLAFWVDR
ncbi:MAG: hypothetical protein Q9165_002600 [Trypethelium subeluteriae]